jgi:RNA polymerase sigma factor (TIGR02999 family)
MGESTAKTPSVTRLLEAWSAGREEVLEQLVPVVYDELRRIARAQLARDRRGHTMQATDLVHEAFVRLIDQRVSWQSRAHFYAIAATCIRRVLVDYARRRRARKRPQFDAGVEAADVERGLDTQLDQMIAIDEGLERLAKIDPRQAQIAEMKFFAEMENEDIAAVLGVSRATVTRNVRSARDFLRPLLGEVA